MRDKVGRLFINSDVSDAFDMETGIWDLFKLLGFAQETIDLLKDMGLENLPTSKELVKDFFGRI